MSIFEGLIYIIVLTDQKLHIITVLIETVHGHLTYAIENIFFNFDNNSKYIECTFVGNQLPITLRSSTTCRRPSDVH